MTHQEWQEDVKSFQVQVWKPPLYTTITTINGILLEVDHFLRHIDFEQDAPKKPMAAMDLIGSHWHLIVSHTFSGHFYRGYHGITLQCPLANLAPRCLPAGLGSRRRARNPWVQMGNLPGVSMSPMVPGPMWRTAKFEVPLGGPQWKHHGCDLDFTLVFRDDCTYMDMDQYLLIPCLGGWTSIYQLFWCHQGTQGFDTLPYHHISQLLEVKKSHRCRCNTH